MQFSDVAGNTSATYSDTIILDTTAPAPDFTTPNEGTTAYQKTTSYTVAWTETEAGSGIASRSLQRQRATYTPLTQGCGVYAADGTAVTTASSVAVTGLLNGSCYRWVQTLTDAVGNVGSGTSGTVVVDTVAPTVTSVSATNPNGYYRAGDTITVTVDGAATVLTEGVEWTAATSNAVTCGSLVTAIEALTGISASTVCSSICGARGSSRTSRQ